MRFLIRIICTQIIIFSCLQSSAQDWFPSGAKWVNIYSEWGIRGYQVATVKKDTSINGVQCKKLEFVFYESCSGNISNVTEQFMFEDSDKIYYLVDNEFTLLYDFTVQPGNSWTVVTHTICGLDTGFVTVDSLYFTLINGVQVKEMRVTGSRDNWGYPFHGIITEFIGSNIYLVPNQDCIADGGGYNLQCYRDSILGEYTINEIPCDSNRCYTGIEAKNAVMSITIFANPAHSLLHITLTEPSLHLQSVQLFSIAGQEVIAEQLLHQTQNTTLNTQHLLSGFYFCHVVLNNGVTLSKKVIICN